TLRAEGNTGVLGGLGDTLPRLRAPARSGSSLAHHSQGADLRADRRHRRGAHDVTTRTTGWPAQLGLSVLLAARCYADPVGAAECRMYRRGWRVPGVAATRRRRQSRAVADHVRHSRRAALDRVGAAVASGLRELGAGACRERGPQPASARRFWRAHGFRLPDAAARPRDDRIRLGPAASVPRPSREDLAGAR